MTRPHIPRFEPEVSQARARAHPDEPARAATTSIDRLQYLGVSLYSRYQQAQEYETMVTALDALPDEHRAHLQAVFCDSSVDAYTLEFDGFLTDTEMRAVADRFENAIFGASRSHNGIHAMVDGIELFTLAGGQKR